MYALYYRKSCPYCIKVLNAIEELGLKDHIMLCDISTKTHADKLSEIGGKIQVPFLHGEGLKMYESHDIIAYLRSNAEKINGER